MGKHPQFACLVREGMSCSMSVSSARFSVAHTHTRSHDPSPGCSGFGGPSGTMLSLESEVLRLCRREKQRLGSRAWEGRSGELEAEREIGGKAFTGGSQGHSQELRSQERCSGGGIDKSQST